MSVPTSSRSAPPGDIRDFKALYRKLERTLNSLETRETTSDLLSGILHTLVLDFQEDLGFKAGRLYSKEPDGLVLRSVAGAAETPPDAYRIPLDYPPVEKILEEGLVIMKRGDPGFDESIEGPIGVSKFAAIAVGDSNHVISFTIKGELREEQILYSLSAVRHVINARLRQEKMAGIMNEARLIQESLLPKGPPEFRGYDIHGQSRPTEIVGGDLFDYLHMSPKLLGVAVADASGHGLPAALLARDVITGLRMGMAEDFKIIRTVEKLNRVIHRSALSSKFASMFYGELEPNGNFFYINAGHTPSLLFRGGAFEELTLGGLVLGPNPSAQYERGYVKLKTGDMIVMYTDGVPECESPAGMQFGMHRLRDLVRQHADSSSREIVDSIFAAADAYMDSGPQLDDMTVVVIRKT
ncbi:MAG TPA: PP2C family protein-serine/threonine phosphatase [Candidatus Saccharimonadales bacterium]|nr:PP2C family protein-serine/threonine phosphatase [Candidatus Saccharimonadales bacterium]